VSVATGWVVPCCLIRSDEPRLLNLSLVDAARHTSEPGAHG
jgi:hypothetical protein